jgi:VanZ family protein
MARDLGNFFIPAAAFGILVIGPLCKHPVFALTLCVSFAVIDESLQNFMPGRTGSVADVIIDSSGAVFASFAYPCDYQTVKASQVSCARSRR